MRIGQTYALADAARAHEDLAGRRTTGKLLPRPQPARSSGRLVRYRRDEQERDAILAAMIAAVSESERTTISLL